MEPGFLENEALLDNLDDDKAVRVKNWLINVSKYSPQKITLALKFVKDLNSLFSDEEVIELKDKFFIQIMSQLEEEYENKRT